MKVIARLVPAFVAALLVIGPLSSRGPGGCCTGQWSPTNSVLAL